MSQADPNASCTNHPAAPAVSSCNHCSKPICKECIVEEVGGDLIFCSSDCRDAYLRIESNLSSVSKTDLIDGLNNPIVNGWKLWGRSFKSLIPYLAIAVVLCAAAGNLAGDVLIPWLGEGQPQEVYDRNPLLAWLFILVFMTAIIAPGIALSQVLISRRYTGVDRGNPFKWAVQRYLPWLATIGMTIAVGWAGFLVLLGADALDMYLASGVAAAELAEPLDATSPMAYLIIGLLIVGVLLIVPGIYCALRFFWADEFALIHGCGPVKALRESWHLTRGKVWDIFSFQFLLSIANTFVPDLLLLAVYLALMLFGVFEIPPYPFFSSGCSTRWLMRRR